jgi:fructokinase
LLASVAWADAANLSSRETRHVISEELVSAEWQIGSKIYVRIGVDLGGTKIEIIALDDDGATLLRRRVRTPVGDYAGTVRTIAELVQSVQSQISTSATVGIATPGALSPQSGLLRNSNSVVLNGKRLDQDISSALGQPIRLENDANCLAISEAADGAGAGCRVVFGAILGTGVGGGIVVDGKILTGLNRIGGEWGHDPLPWATDSERPGHRCYCGKYGCIETFLSGAGLTREYFSRSRKELPAEQIAALELAGDPHAAGALTTYKNRLARSLATVVNILDPDVIVLGGGISNIGVLYGELLELIAEHAFSDGIRTPVARAAHGDSSGVRGAAWLWPIYP